MLRGCSPWHAAGGSRAAADRSRRNTISSDSAIVINQKHYIRQGNVEIETQADIEALRRRARRVLRRRRPRRRERQRRVRRRARIGLPPTAPSSTRRRGSARSTTRAGIADDPAARRSPSGPGSVAPPQLIGQETDVYFFGETVEKIGAEEVQDHQRRLHDLRAADAALGPAAPSTVVLNIDHYTLLENAIMTVKGVPMLYLPVLYYPTKKDDRATGFLIPTYGSSTLRGQSIHNAFFWAINRSQDATVPARLVLEGRSGRRQRVSLQLRRRLRRQHPRVLPRSARDELRARRRATSDMPPARATRSTAARTSCCPAACARARASTTSRASSRSRRSTRTSTTPQRNQRSYRRQRRRRVAHLFAERARSTTASTSIQRPTNSAVVLRAAGRACRCRETNGRCSASPFYFIGRRRVRAPLSERRTDTRPDCRRRWTRA